MAVYFTLAIDCGQSLSAASNIAASFRPLSISVPNVPPIKCKVLEDERDGSRIVTIWPMGLGYACPGFREDVLNRASFFLIRDTLLDHLRTLSGFRVALFGDEALDGIELGDLAALEKSVYPGYVISEAILPPGSSLMNHPLFSPGYRWIPDPEGTCIGYLPQSWSDSTTMQR